MKALVVLLMTSVRLEHESTCQKNSHSTRSKQHMLCACPRIGYHFYNIWSLRAVGNSLSPLASKLMQSQRSSDSWLHPRPCVGTIPCERNSREQRTVWDKSIHRTPPQLNLVIDTAFNSSDYLDSMDSAGQHHACNANFEKANISYRIVATCAEGTRPTSRLVAQTPFFALSTSRCQYP